MIAGWVSSQAVAGRLGVHWGFERLLAVSAGRWAGGPLLRSAAAAAAAVEGCGGKLCAHLPSAVRWGVHLGVPLPSAVRWGVHI